MDTTYTKLDLGYLIDSDWSAIEDYFRIDDSGIWLLEESAPELRWLTQDERDLFMIHPDANPNFPVLPFPFTMKQFLKFADLPATELHDSYLFADDTVDVVAIERLERMYAPSGALARALMFGELPKLAQLKEIQGEAASAYAAPVLVETTEQRRARWLDWYGKGERGAVERVYERELLLNPRADRSFIGKEINKAKNEKAEAKRGGAMFGQLVQDGKRTG